MKKVLPKPVIPLGLAVGLVVALAACEPKGWFGRDVPLPPLPKAGALAAVDPPPKTVSLDQLQTELHALASDAKEAAPPALKKTEDKDPPEARAGETQAGGGQTTDQKTQAGDDASLTGVEKSLPDLGPLLADPALKNNPDTPLFIAMAKEIAGLRDDVERMRQQMDSQLGSYVGDLRMENERLRQEVQRLYAMTRQNGGTAPMLPQSGSAFGGPMAGGAPMPGEGNYATDPNAPLVKPEPPQSPAQTQTDSSDEAVPNNAKKAMAIVGNSAAKYAVLVEWGRSPQEAMSLGKNVSSLRGMIIVVPEDTTQDQLTALGKQLHDEYKDYDNINIQVFNNADAARNYAKTNSQDKGGPVMHISKFKNRGDDSIILYKDGKAFPLQMGTGTPVGAVPN